MTHPVRHGTGPINGWPKLVCDAVLFAVAFVVASVAGSSRLPERGEIDHLLAALTLLVPVKLMSFHVFGAYRCIWHYTSIESLQELLLGAAAGAAATWALAAFSGWTLFASPFVLMMDAALGLLLVAGARIAVRLAYPSLASRRRPAPRALIIGAGDAGEMIVREMRRRVRLHFHPVGFVDDDPRKAGYRIHGVPVVGSRDDIPRLVERLRIETVIIAIPSASAQTLEEIVCACRRTHADLKILPDLGGLMDSTVGLSRLRSVEILDLLGRAPVDTDRCDVVPHLSGKRVLVTGAGGSIGSELCRQILRFAPSSLVMLGRGENSIHQVYHDLAPIAGRTRLVQVIGDVINKAKLARVFEMHRPHVVFHAGADKHVPLMELCPDEAVLNNIIGTRNVLDVANVAHCEKVVCISSDKAVRPTSVMGCTKRVAELLIRSPLYPNTRAVAVRFGNVFGSRGSVIPQFQDQIARGGPVTVTNKGISRYFMTIPEAVELVLVAGAMGRGGEIFVLDMGSPVRIWDLAVGMARLAGLEPGIDIELKETGLRPGEKLHEDLFFADEHRSPTRHPRITCARHDGVNPLLLCARIDELHGLALKMDFDGIRRELARLIPDYRPAGTPWDRDETVIATTLRSTAGAAPRARALEAAEPA
jgi:FlaA1/EpsC-like NDP-sugar epimerase